MGHVALPRENLVDRRCENWRPPGQSSSQFSVSARIRRFFDVQLSSIWRDMSHLLPQLTGKVADIGCGAQPFRALLDGSVKYVGLDIEEAEQRFGYRMPDTLYYSGKRFPLEDASADHVLCTETLEHVESPAAFLDEVRRCLKPGGTLLLTVPYAARWHFVCYDFWRWTPMGIKMVLDAHGFSNIRVYARGNRITVACYKCMAVALAALFPQGKSWRTWPLRVMGLLLLPMFIAAAVLSRFTYRMSWGLEDCLGYTVLAERAGKSEPVVSAAGGAGAS